MEFDTRKKTGMFYDAFGTASLGERVERSMFGTQEPDAMFRGREIHKIGPKKYRIVDGAFTSCVQPTPRWEIVSGKADLVLDDYALMKNTVLRVKGVPLMYMPIFYYPIQEDDRATGFLMPAYGNVHRPRAVDLSNAFLLGHQPQPGRHDRARLVLEVRPGSRAASTGTCWHRGHRAARTSPCSMKRRTPTTGVGHAGGGRSYRVDGSLVQQLGRRVRAQANANYFSSLGAEQTYQQDFSRATQSTRNFGGNISRSWPRIHAVRARWTGSTTSTARTAGPSSRPADFPGSTSRAASARSGRRGCTSASAANTSTILRSTTQNDEEVANHGLTRLDVNPTIRFPFTSWPFLTVNSCVGWRGTYWTESSR